MPAALIFAMNGCVRKKIVESAPTCGKSGRPCVADHVDVALRIDGDVVGHRRSRSRRDTSSRRASAAPVAAVSNFAMKRVCDAPPPNVASSAFFVGKFGSRFADDHDLTRAGIGDAVGLDPRQLPPRYVE